MPIFSEDIYKKYDISNCPSRSYIQYMDDNFVIDTSKGNIDVSTLPDCNISNPNQTGCCKVPANVPCRENTSMGLKYLIDTDGVDMCYNICHTDEIQLDQNNMFEDPNKISKFFKLIFVSILALFITATIGTCYEFWLRYGNSKECIYYKSKCNNIGKSNEINIIDFIFPNSICYYPYQECKFSQSGGKKMKGGEKELFDTVISNYSSYNSSGAKCITLNLDSDNKNYKAFPYNIADWAEDNIDNEYIKQPLKAFSFFFLFPVLLSRFFINLLLSNLSEIYQKKIKHNPGLSNFIFLLLTGLFFPIIAYMTGINSFSYGIGSWLIPFILIISVCGCLGYIVSFVVTCLPERFLDKKGIDCGLDSKYYGLLTLYNLSKLFYPFRSVGLKDKLINLLLNILLSIPVLLTICLFLVFGGAGNIIAMIYMNISFIWNIFYIPLSNPIEFFDILKSHADLLTLLFCVGVVGSSSVSLDKNTTAIMSVVLVCIIFYKTVTGLKNSM